MFVLKFGGDVLDGFTSWSEAVSGAIHLARNGTSVQIFRLCGPGESEDTEYVRVRPSPLGGYAFEFADGLYDDPWREEMACLYR